MNRIARTWRLAQQAWRVLRADRELAVLPVFSFVTTALVAATFLIPGFSTGLLAGGDPGPAGWVLLFLFYVAATYVTIFFNAALVLAADERMRGGDPTVDSALRAASRHAGRMLPWAVVSATVSVILQALEEQGWIGSIVSSLLGLAWSLITFLVIPVLVIEEVGVGTAIRRSTELFKRTWGENVAARIGFGLLGFVAALPAVALVVLGVLAGSAAGILLIALAVLWVAGTAVVLAALNSIFQVALYHYAVDGHAPSGYFDDRLLERSFMPRRGGLFR